MTKSYLEEFLTSLDSQPKLNIQEECLEQIKILQNYIKSEAFDLLDRQTKIKFLKDFHRINFDLNSQIAFNDLKTKGGVVRSVADKNTLLIGNINTTNETHKSIDNRVNNQEKTSNSYNTRYTHKIYKAIAVKNKTKTSTKDKKKKRKWESKKCQYVIQGYYKLFPRRFIILEFVSIFHILPFTQMTNCFFHILALFQITNILYRFCKKINTSIKIQIKG